MSQSASPPHIIRLRGPWNYEPLVRYVPTDDGRIEERKDNLPVADSINFPADWRGILDGRFNGLIRFTRLFHRPSGLTANSRSWLVIDDVDNVPKVSLNDNELVESQTRSPTGTNGSTSFDIGRLLRPQNRLSVTLDSRPRGSVFSAILVIE